MLFERVVDDFCAFERERVAPPAVPPHEVVCIDVLSGTDCGEVDTEQSRADDDTGVSFVGVFANAAGVLERPEVVDTVGVGVFDWELCWRTAGRHQQFVVLVCVTLVRVNFVGVCVDFGDVGVEFEVDVAFVVPVRLVDGNRCLWEFALGELLDENAVVQRFTFVGNDRNIGVRVLFPKSLGGGTPGNAISDDYVRRAHGTRLDIMPNVDCYLSERRVNKPHDRGETPVVQEIPTTSGKLKGLVPVERSR